MLFCVLDETSLTATNGNVENGTAHQYAEVDMNSKWLVLGWDQLFVEGSYRELFACIAHVEKRKNRTALSPESVPEESLYDNTSFTSTLSGEEPVEQDTYNKLSHGERTNLNHSNRPEEDAVYNHISPENTYNTIPQNFQPNGTDEDTYSQLSHDTLKRREVSGLEG
jgi:hypothetical protein